RLGVCPTPALAHLTGSGPFRAGIMVSASHNPADDNGLKVLDEAGLKIDEPLEDELEALIWRADELSGPRNDGLGREVDGRQRLAAYEAHRLRLASTIHSDVSLVLDCANGSGGMVGPQILAGSGARVDVRFNEPDGTNINLHCGATSPAAAARAVAETGADLGFALDGDADRCVAIDEHGRVVDGDQLIGIIALDRLARRALPGGICVVSGLSNGGLEAAITAAGGRVARTPVGDRYILEGMLVAGAGLGGEKSGHVIVREHASSGDGIVTALELLGILARSGRRLSELAAQISLFPQQQRTVPARHKEQWEADPTFADAVAEAQRTLDGSGRVLVRPSGTEAALRIMVEGQQEEQVVALADQLASLAGQRLN
ncbi:MAG: phosphoglucosamine mutase, partial [Chloroflexota bacterium]|nr:phosphoglucosamine mutase [Chloroflexota bacterium]